MSIIALLAAAAAQEPAGGQSNRQAIMPASRENRQFFEK